MFNQLLEKCRILVLALGVVADSPLVLDPSSALGYHEGGVELAKGAEGMAPQATMAGER